MQGIQNGWVTMSSSDKTWSTGGENGKLLQYSCCENYMNVNGTKRQKDMTPEDESPVGRCQCATGEDRRAITNSSRKKWSGLAKAAMTLSCGCIESKVVMKVKSGGE